MKHDGPLLLGLDLGSSRLKALLVDGDGQPAESAEAPAPFETSSEGTEAAAAAILGALEHVLSELGEARRRVGGVGVAGIAESGVPLDARGTPLAPIIAWHDRRGEDVADRLAEQFGPELHRRVGQRLRYVSTVAKLGWLLDRGLPRPSRWLGVSELCLHALTGSHATEWSLAGRTGCLDVVRGEWLPEVAEAAGFDAGVFPAIGAAGEELGKVTAHAAARFGLPPGIPVTLGGHDHLVGMVGSGAERDDFADSVGTAETVLARTPQLPDLDQAIERSLAVGLFPGRDGWAVLAGAARSGLAVEAAAEALGASPRELDGLAADQGPDAPLVDAPELAASLDRREPPALPDGPPGAVWATLLDALARFTAEAVNRVAEVVSPRSRLVVFGGGSGSEPWLAAKARHVPVPLWRSHVAEAVAQGAAVFGGVAAGWWPTPDAAPRPELERA